MDRGNYIIARIRAFVSLKVLPRRARRSLAVAYRSLESHILSYTVERERACLSSYCVSDAGAPGVERRGVRRCAATVGRGPRARPESRLGPVEPRQSWCRRPADAGAVGSRAPALRTPHQWHEDGNAA